MKAIDYQVMPELTAEEYAELKADIQERGVMVPIEFDQDGNIIDGYHRYRICRELGWINGNGDTTDAGKGRVATVTRIYPNEDAKFTQARKLNLARRHLTPIQREKLVKDEIQANPQKTDRQIANDLGNIHHATVSRIRSKLEKSGDVSHCDTSIDTLGREQPRERKPASPPPVRPVPTPAVFNPSRRDREAVRDPDIQRRLAENDGMNVAGAIREQKRDHLIEHLESVETQEAKAVQGVYDVIVIDPPWPMQRIELDARPHAIAMDYPTMSLDEIKALEIPAADDCHVFMWTTQKFLRPSFDVFDAWGVKHCWTFVWVKDNGYKPMNLPKSSVEFVLYGHIGNPKFIDETNFWSHITAPITGHSEKPDAFYGIVRRVTAGRRLDMFNRRKIDGFDVWGKEANK